MKALKQEKVDILFGYPGGQAIDLFNALYGQKEIEVILPRHEQVATNLIGNDAFQEVDIVGITRNISKYAVTVRSRQDLGRIIKRLFILQGLGSR